MRIILFLSLTVILSSCTPYQKSGLAGGYTETQLDTNVFKVNFGGNAYTSQERATDFTLLRSAEITLENDFSYFVIVDASQDTSHSSYTTPSRTYITSTGPGTAIATTRGGDTMHYSRPRTSNTIVCFKEKPKDFSYNARFVKKSLEDKYQLNKPKK